MRPKPKKQIRAREGLRLVTNRRAPSKTERREVTLLLFLNCDDSKAVA